MLALKQKLRFLNLIFVLLSYLIFVCLLYFIWIIFLNATRGIQLAFIVLALLWNPVVVHKFIGKESSTELELNEKCFKDCLKHLYYGEFLKTTAIDALKASLDVLKTQSVAGILKASISILILPTRESSIRYPSNSITCPSLERYKMISLLKF